MRTTANDQFTSMPRRSRRTGALAATLVLAAFAILVPAASAAIPFGAIGSGAGQTDNPAGIAVDNSNDHVYVADSRNNRIDVFDSSGSFLFAFGWGVADGSGELQTCNTASGCVKALGGGGAGQLLSPRYLAVDNSGGASNGDLYVFEQVRIQKFSIDDKGTAGNPLDDVAVFDRAWGGGVITGGANGKGDLSSGSTVVENVVTSKKAFAAGQTISGTGIPAGATITAIGPGTITLSKAATVGGVAVGLTVAEGEGNVPVNEVQILESLSKLTRGLAFTTGNPSPTVGSVALPLPIANNAPASGPNSLQELLVSFSNIDPGDVSVTGPNGGPYSIEFKGRYADTDVEPLKDLESGGPPGTPVVTTTQNGGGSAELCTVAITADCSNGVEGKGNGQFGSISNPISVGPGGIVYVADTEPSEGEVSVGRIVKFEPSGALVGTSLFPGASQEVNSIAVDSTGDAYIVRNGAIEKYETSEPNATLLYSLDPGKNTRALALDPADNLFAAQVDGGFRTVAKYSPSGEPLKRFGYGAIENNLGGLAFQVTPSGDIFASEENVASDTSGNKIIQLQLPPPGPIACCAKAGPIGNAKATLSAQINPEGKETKYHFEYVEQQGFESGGFANPATKSTPEVALAADATLHAVSVQASVVPSTKYHFRVVAKNIEGEASSSGEFESLPPLEIGDTFATEVGTDAAQLHAEVNPLGIPTSAYFEYVDDATFQASGFAEASQAPDIAGGVAPIDLGSGETAQIATAQISALSPATTYHYRVIASDPFVTVAGGPRTLITFPLPSAPAEGCSNQVFRTGASANLPNCRAFEMVSPVNKGNTDISVRVSAQNFPAGFDRGADDGERFSFSSEKSFGDAVSAPYTSQYLARRVDGVGWSTNSISPSRGPKSLSDAVNIKYDGEYKAFSADLSASWFLHNTDPALNECAVEGFLNLYRRAADGSYEALTTAKPTNQTGGVYFPELQGLSADGTHTIFRANGKLTKDAANIEGYQLYEHVSEVEGCGTVRLVSILPNGKATTAGASAGTAQNNGAEFREQVVANAVSADGSRIYWTASPSTPGPLYVRINGLETVQVSAGPAQFWSAADDGSKAIYAVQENLFEFDLASKSSTLIAGKAGPTFGGVAAASNDASHVYFVSSETLGGEGEAGKPNLYLRDEGATSYIATLAVADVNPENSFFGFGAVSRSPISRGTRVSADGNELAFVSTASLTGYDNKDAENGAPAVELFIYNASADSLACVSCNPSGARPAGRRFDGNNGSFRQIAAQMAPWANELFAPRALSSDGNHLFFDSFESLVPRDTNGKEDVYEWDRAAGAEGCESIGAELYVPTAEGCLSLISSGQSPSDSEMVDATPDGSDVFIKTASSLLPQDPGLIDVYDARVNGGFAPHPPPPAACEGEACQGPLSPPNDPTPASAAGEYAGNVREKHKPPHCAKGKVRRKGHCVRKPSKHHQKKNKKRANDNRGAGR